MTILVVKVNPNASKNSIEGWQGDVLRIRLQATPEKGKANEALIAFLSQVLGIQKSSIEILSGHASRIKRFKIEGLSLEQVIKKLSLTK